MSKYGTREAELDELLRREVFVDLYTVVRQAMRVGEPGYSLKNMEAFYPLERDAEVTEAGGSILAYQEWLESRDQAKLDAIAEYNADDCRSTRALRDWLLEERRRGRARVRDRAAQPRRQAGARAERACRRAPVRAGGPAGAADGRRRRADRRPRRARAPAHVGSARVPPPREPSRSGGRTSSG